MPSCKIRPHHGLCTAFFVGKGYDSEFTANMRNMIDMLESLDPVVTLTAETDVICKKCPNNVCGKCKSSKPEIYDAKVSDLTGITVNTDLKWSVFRDTVKEKIIESGRLSEVCGDCQWFRICGNNQ